MCVTPSNIIFRHGSLEEVLPLRARELRKGKPMDSARFEEDDLSTTIHLGAFLDNHPIGCLTLIRITDLSYCSWQLRGMATRQSWQGKGVGRGLLRFTETYLLHHFEHGHLWCNAREIAIPFYHKLGFEICSKPFDIPKIGLHYKMEKSLL